MAVLPLQRHQALAALAAGQRCAPLGRTGLRRAHAARVPAVTLQDSQPAAAEQWCALINRIKVQCASVVVPIGLLHMGAARHRALLFKVLAGDLGLPCRVVRGAAGEAGGAGSRPGAVPRWVRGLPEAQQCGSAANRLLQRGAYLRGWLPLYSAAAAPRGTAHPPRSLPAPAWRCRRRHGVDPRGDLPGG